MKTILLVDDCDETRALLKDLLSIESINIHEAPSGQIAMEILKDKTIDLVISDLEMENGNGRWLLREIQKLDFLPKVVILSGDISANEQNMKEAGAQAFFSKPFKEMDLIQYIRSFN